MFMRRFLKWWQDKSVKGTGKELQHHIDTYKVYTLARYKKIVSQQGGVDKSTLMRDKDEQKEFFEECQDSSFEEQQTHIREHIIRELLTVFSVFHQAAPLKVPKNAEELFDKVVEARDTDPSNTIPQFINAQQTVEPSKASIKNFNKMNNALMKKLGYSLHVQQSGIPNAGPGLFLEGSAVAGTVICMYPGIVYLKEYVVSGDTDGMFGPDDSGTYTMGRYDGSIFNGDCEPQWHPSPVSYGHLIRHPTGILPLTEDHRGLPRVLGKPNVMSCPFNYPELDSGGSETQRSIFSRLKDAPGEKPATTANVDIEKYLDKGMIGKKFPKEFQAYIPNTYYKPPVLLSTQEAKESYTFGIALIATENIKDEEIYLDYRYNPHLETPSWYKTIDEETAQRRWKDHHTYANQ